MWWRNIEKYSLITKGKQFSIFRQSRTKFLAHWHEKCHFWKNAGHVTSWRFITTPLPPNQCWFIFLSLVHVEVCFEYKTYRSNIDSGEGGVKNQNLCAKFLGVPRILSAIVWVILFFLNGHPVTQFSCVSVSWLYLLLYIFL